MIQLELPLEMPQSAMLMCPINDLFLALSERRSLYGWKTALMEAIGDSSEPGRITEHDLCVWQKRGLCPQWLVDEVPFLRLKRKRNHKSVTQPDWSDAEFDFLIEQYNDGKIKNRLIAERCSDKFGRTITENAIKGAIHRLRARELIIGFRYNM